MREQFYVVLSHIVSVALENYHMYQLKTDAKHQHRTQEHHKKRSRSPESHNTPLSLHFRRALTIQVISTFLLGPASLHKKKKRTLETTGSPEPLFGTPETSKHSPGHRVALVFIAEKVELNLDHVRD